MQSPIVLEAPLRLVPTEPDPFLTALESERDPLGAASAPDTLSKEPIRARRNAEIAAAEPASAALAVG